MSQYKDVRNRAWFNELYHDEQANKEFSLTDTIINTQHLNTATLDWMMMIEENGQFDDFLLMEYKQQFEDWSEDIIGSIDQRIRKAMKELFRSRGIYMPVYSRDTITTQFMELLSLTKCPAWPEEELALAMLNPNFKCRQMTTMRSRRLATSRPTTPPSPPPPTSPPPPSNAHAQPTSVRALTDLSKLYNDEL